MLRRVRNIFFLNFFLSLSIVAFGQPARLGWLGALAALIGFSLFFYGLPSRLSQKQRFFCGAIWFTAIQLIQLSWMTTIEFQGLYILLVYSIVAIGLGCQFGLLTLLIPKEANLQLRQGLSCAALWTLMEWIRLQFLCGFSWNPIGLALTHFIPSLQFSSAIGILGLSFWVMLTNLLGLNALRSKLTSSRMVYWIFAATIPYFFGFLQLNYLRPFSERSEGALEIALIQTDLLPSQKCPLADRATDFISPFEQWDRIFMFLEEKRMPRWDLIVLPEAALPMPSDLSTYPYAEARKRLIKIFGPEVERKFPPLRFPFAEKQFFQNCEIWCVSNLFWCQTLANLYDAEVVAGLDHSDRQAKKNYNSAFYFKPGNLSFERYDKQILLPLAEYLPFECLKPLTKRYGIYDFFSHGEGTKVFGNKISFSPSICYEETFSEVIRYGKVKGAELFVNVTNDNYYPDSTLHKQHLFHARLRAVENGIPLIRACNSGISAAIDSFGRLQSTFEAEDEHSGKDGVLNSHLKIFHFPTLFSFWGEGGIVSLCFIFFFYHWRMRPH